MHSTYIQYLINSSRILMFVLQLGGNEHISPTVTDGELFYLQLDLPTEHPVSFYSLRLSVRLNVSIGEAHF